MKRDKKKRRWPCCLLLLVLLFVVIRLLSYYNLIPEQAYSAADFGIETLQSAVDQDGDGLDDYTDIMLGARDYVETKPVYRSAYWEGGYPPEGEGVCTDVIWQAFSAAGYDLKALVDADIAANVALYPRVEGKPDPNIDFRRVPNLEVFFSRFAESITLDPLDIAAWQPGDIVVYKNHIGIISDKRNKDGQPYIIHHGGGPKQEEDALTRQEIIGHYRWNPKEGSSAIATSLFIIFRLS